MGQDAGTPGCGDVDLSTTVTRLNRIKAKNKARLANSDLTRAFLDSGLALTTEVFSQAADASSEAVSPTLAYLSRPRVLIRAQRDYPELVPTEAKFRDRWAGHQDFVEDFVAYALLARHCRLRQAIAEWSRELVESETDFATAVHRVAYEGSKLVLRLPAYRLQLLAISSVAADPDVSTAIKRMYESLTTDWFELFGRVVEAFGFRLRRGVSSQEFNVLLQAVTEGLGIRLLAGLDEPLVDEGRRESLLGTAVLALCVSLTDNGDGLTIEEAANRQLSLRRKGTG